MIKELLVIMSFLNETPYITLGSHITQAKSFPIKPDKFNDLIEISINGDFKEKTKICKLTKEVFSSLEDVLLKKGLQLYTNKL